MNYQKKLPHRQPKDGVFNICFRLANSLPKEVFLQLKESRDFRILELQQKLKNPKEIQTAIQNERHLYFGKFDTLLDSCDFGPTHLKNKEIAEIVAQAFHYRHEKKIFKLICYCVMPNHVHAILYKTQKPLFRILQSLKRHTAKQANLILGNTGNPFWQAESYDNLVRDRNDLKVKITYILNNPVKAGLCKHWQDWAFSFLNPEFSKYMNA